MNKSYPLLLNIIWSKVFLLICFIPLFLFGIFFYFKFPNEFYYELVSILSRIVKTYIRTRGQISQIDFGLNKIGSLLIIISIICPILLMLSKWILNNIIHEVSKKLEKLPNPDFNKMDWLIITLLFLIAAILRIIPINQSLWQPEICSYQVFMEPGVMATFLPKSAVGPHPFMQIIGIIFTNIFGVSDFTLRFPFYLISVLSIPLLYFISLKLTANRLFAVIAGLLFALHSYHIFLSFQMRAYGMMAFFAIISFYFSVKLLSDPKRKTAILLSITNILLVYSQMYGVLLVLAQVLSLFSIILIERILNRDILIISPKAGIEFFYSFIVTLLFSFLLYITHIPVTAMSLFNTEFTRNLSFFDYFIKGVRSLYHIASIVSMPKHIYLTFGILFVIITVLMLKIKKNSFQYMLFFTFSFTILLTISLKSGQGFYPRYLSCTLPLFILLLTFVIYELWKSKSLLKKVCSIFVLGGYLFISFEGYSNSYRKICPLNEALKYVELIDSSITSTIYGDEYSYPYMYWYNKNVKRYSNINELNEAIKLNQDFFVIIGTTTSIVDSLDTGKYKAIEKIENEFHLVKTIDGHFPIYVWNKISK